MNRWAEDYEDAFYDPYDDEDDDYEEDLPPPPKSRQEPAKQTLSKSLGPREQKKKTRNNANSKAETPDKVSQDLDGTISIGSLPEFRSLEVPNEAAERLPLSEYRMEAELAKLCTAMEDSQITDLETLHLVILGHVDAGKSTLMGRLLHDLGYVDQRTVHRTKKEAEQAGKASFSWAWVLDERPEERARGVTVDVAISRFQTDKLNVVLLDAPGHRDFVPNMISGAAQADAALLVVDGSVNGFEAGFQSSGPGLRSVGGGQTREHAQLARSLGVEQLAVVVTKLDTCDYSQERFDDIKSQLLSFLLQCGFKRTAIQWLLASAPTGVNMTEKPLNEPLLSWFDGPTVVQAVNKFEPITRNLNTPLRFPVMDVVKSRALGPTAVSGKIEAGAVRIGSRVSVMPTDAVAVVKAIEVNGKIRSFAKAGESCEIGLNEIEPSSLFVGSVLCAEGWQCPVTKKFECRVAVLEPAIPIIPGLHVSLQAHAIRESGQISRLISMLDSKTGEIIKSKPRCLTKGQTAMIEVTTVRPVCLEVYASFRALGRITIRESGRTIAVGIVTRIEMDTRQRKAQSL